MKKVIYLRVSTEDQLIGHSIHTQLQGILKTFNLKEEECIVIRDEGLSAKDDNRPGYKQIIQMLESGETLELYASTLDRLNRNTSNNDHLIYNLIALTKSKLYLVNGQNDFETSIGVLMNKVQSALAEFESKQVSERTSRIMKQMREDGKWTGGRLPLGISLDEEKRPYYNPESEIVLEVFNYYFNDSELHQMVEQLSLKYPRYKWDRNKIRRILTNTLYGGYKIIKGEKYQLIAEPLVPPEKIPKNIVTHARKQRFYQKPPNSKNKYKLRGKVFIDGKRSYLRTTPDKKQPQDLVYWHYVKGAFFSEEKILTSLEKSISVNQEYSCKEEAIKAIEIDDYKEAIKCVQKLRVKSALSETLDLRKLKKIEINSQSRKAVAYYDGDTYQIDLSK